MTEVPEIMQAIADHLGTALPGTADLAGFEVYPLLTFNPTPPAIDMYPAAPFYEQTAYGGRNAELQLTIRARVAGDQQEQQKLLLRMMDPRADESVAAALDGENLGGSVNYVRVDPPTDYQLFVDPGGDALLGCTWLAKVGL